MNNGSIKRVFCSLIIPLCLDWNETLFSFFSIWGLDQGERWFRSDGVRWARSLSSEGMAVSSFEQGRVILAVVD